MKEERQNHALVRVAWAMGVVVQVLPSQPFPQDMRSWLTDTGVIWRHQNLWKALWCFPLAPVLLRGALGQGCCLTTYWHCHSGRGDCSQMETFLIIPAIFYFCFSLVLKMWLRFSIVEWLSYLCFIKPLGKKKILENRGLLNNLWHCFIPHHWFLLLL